MPVTYGFTKRGQIEYWLKDHQGEIVFARDLAAMFNTSSSNITSFFQELARNGWIVEKQSSGMNTGWILRKK